MNRRLFLTLATGALFAAPQPRLAEPRVTPEGFRWFTLAETMKDVEERIGAPAAVGDFGVDYQTWHYRFGGTDEHDFSHYFVFRRSTRCLVSVTRAYDPEQKVDAMFPSAETKVVATSGLEPRYGARVRRLAGGLILIAPGSTAPGEPTSQLALIRESDLANFFPWVADGLKSPR